MNSIWPVLIACLLAFAGSRIVLANSRARGQFDEATKFVVVRRQRSNVFLAIVVVVAPWPLIVKLASERGHPPNVVFPAFILFFSIVGVGVGLLAYALRKITFDRDGVYLSGPAQVRLRWCDLHEVDAVVQGGIASLKLVFDRKIVRVDSTFDGFRELVCALDVWPTGNAKVLAEKAVRELAEWRNDPGSKKKSSDSGAP